MGLSTASLLHKFFCCQGLLLLLLFWGVLVAGEEGHGSFPMSQVHPCCPSLLLCSLTQQQHLSASGSTACGFLNPQCCRINECHSSFSNEFLSLKLKSLTRSTVFSHVHLQWSLFSCSPQLFLHRR